MGDQQIDFGGLGALSTLFDDDPGEQAELPGATSSANVSREALLGAGGVDDLVVPSSPMQGAAAAAPGPAPQIALGPALDYPLENPQRFIRHSVSHMEHMRAAARVAKAKARETATKAKLDTAVTALSSVCALLPDAAKIVHQPQAPRIGRKKDPQPEDLALAARALYLAQNSKLNLGVRLDRLQHLGANVVLERQQEAFGQALQGLSMALSPSAGAARAGHISFVHLWDEVEAKFRFSPEMSKANAGAMTVQTLVQRGVVAFCLAGGDRSSKIAEHWLARPSAAPGTSASSLYSGLRSFWPTDFLDISSVTALLSCASSFTYMPMCDKASGNMSLLRHIGHHFETQLWANPAVGAKALMWPDVCSAHLHHRGKLQVKGLRPHIMRQFGLAKLLRLRGVQSQVLERLEGLIAERLVRIEQPPPEHDGVSMTDVVEILAKPTEDFHKRKRGESEQLKDLRRLCAMLNGDLLEGGETLTHYCWDSSSSQPGTACCEDREDCIGKMAFACSRALFGSADPVPAESRWTNVLTNIKKLLLRACAKNLGVAALQFGVAAGPAQSFEVDGDAAEDYFTMVNRSRLQKTRDYFGNPATLPELVVYAALLEVSDSHLLYPFLDDALREDGGHSKLELVVHPEVSKVAMCFQELYGLLSGGWPVGNMAETSGYWKLLVVAGAPIKELAFLQWARSQILRLVAALYRRYELRFSSWPYKLYALFCPAFTEDHRRRVISELLGARSEVLDIYSRGIRKLFPTPERLQSVHCQAVLEGDFARHAHNIAQVERLNAELTRGHNPRAPPRSFPNTADNMVLRQARAVHRHRGGREPLAPQALGRQQPLEQLLCNPLLPVSGTSSSAASSLPLPAPPAPHPDQGPHTGQPSSSNDNSAIVASGVTRQSGLGDIAPAAFADHVLVERANPAFMGGGQPARLGGHQRAPSLQTAQPAQKSGLSPYMLQKNRHLADAKAALGRTMTTEERQMYTDEFKDMWAKMDHSVFKQVYEVWREGPRKAALCVAPTPYVPSWGGGCQELPITKDEMHTHLLRHGWPTDEALRRRAAGGKSAADAPDLTATPDYDIWGLSRYPRNVDRYMTDKHKFEICDKGLFNLLEHRLGKDKADAGDVMLVVSGPSATQPGQTHRCGCIIAGTCYSPKVWDAACVFFEDEEHKHHLELQVPCWVCLSTRKSLLSDSMTALEIITSDEFVLRLTNSMSRMEVAIATYETTPRDGCLLYSRITGLEVAVSQPSPPFPSLACGRRVGAQGHTALVDQPPSLHY